MKGLRIIVTSPGPGYRGRRARRAAFYARQRDARRMGAALRLAAPKLEAYMQQAYLDSVVRGLGWVEASRRDGQTFFNAGGAEVPPPDGSTRDGSIASMLTVRRLQVIDLGDNLPLSFIDGLPHNLPGLREP